LRVFKAGRGHFRPLRFSLVSAIISIEQGDF
jgi:hypothetical protein